MQKVKTTFTMEPKIWNQLPSKIKSVTKLGQLPSKIKSQNLIIIIIIWARMNHFETRLMVLPNKVASKLLRISAWRSFCSIIVRAIHETQSSSFCFRKLIL